MHAHLTLLDTWQSVRVVADGLVPDPAPQAPPGNAGSATSTLIAWLKWGALACCLASMVLAGGMIAVGNTSRRAELAERGKVTMICAVLGAIVVAIGGSLVSSSYGLG